MVLKKIIPIIAGIIFIITTIFVVIYTSKIIASADTVGCMVICEVPEKPVRYTIPKVKGSGYFELKEGQIIYQEIEGKTYGR